MSFQFEWDPDKAAQNKRKHQISFEEASTVFADFLSATIPDPDHSDTEDRYITIGTSKQQRPLMVSYTEHGNQIRIISARKLTSVERKQYEETI